jgi:branched-chain amino acid transport system permease protein
LHELPQQIINGLLLGAIYALIALGYTMIYGVLRFVNFAHGDVFMVGSFSGFYIAPYLMKGLADEGTKLPFTPPFAQYSIPGAVCVLLCAMIVCALLGMLTEKVAYRPLRNRPRLTVLITAIGVSIFLEYAGQFVFGADPQHFPQLIDIHSIDNIGSFSLASRNLSMTNLDFIVLCLTLFLLFALRIIVQKTKMGMAMRALSFNPTACSLMGVNNDAVISFTFALGSALAGAGGILFAAEYPSIDPLLGLNVGLKAFVAAVLGGIGNIPGAALGGFLIGIIETMVIAYWSSEYKDAIVFALLIVILVVKPTGLLGKSEREKV